jgi:hypothetical protein
VAKTPFKVVDTDKGYRRTLAALGPLGRVTLGVQGDKGQAFHQGSDATVADIAYYHELGLGVPERSWLRAWIDENQAMILEDSRDAMKQVILGKLTRQRALGVLGVKWSAAIKQRIRDGQVQPALDQTTIDRKGSSTPLLDTAQLLSAITYLAETEPSLVAQLLRQ